MAVSPQLNDGESFVPGRSEETARRLIEAAQEADIDVSRVVTTSHGYIVPSEIAGAVEGETRTAADRPAVPTEPGTTTDPDEATNVGGLSQDEDEQTKRANEDAERQASPEPDEATDEEATPDIPEDSDPERGVRTANDARREANEAPTADEGGDTGDDAEQFDPADHTVDEVWDYLEDADDAERTRVLEAEKAGKNRKAFQSETEGDK